MEKSLQLKQERAGFQSEIDQILATAKTESRDVTADELAKMKELRGKIDGMKKAIEDAEFVEAEQLRSAAAAAPAPAIHTEAKPKGEAEQKRHMRKNVSLRAIIAAAADKTLEKLDGMEAELIQEGRSEMIANKRSPQGVALPGFMMKPNSTENRAQSVGTSTQSGALVATEIGEVIEYLYPKTVLREMGTNFITNLSSNYDLIRQDGPSTATWEGENDDNANTDPTVENVPMRPKRLGAQTTISKQLVFQTNSIDVENWIRNDLNTAQGVALETAALNGSGTAPIPRGILNFAGIGDVAIGTNGGAPTWAHLVELESTIADLNAEYGNLAYLTTAPLRGKLKTTTKDAGSGQFIWDRNEVNGYRAFISTVLPKDLTKGTSNDCHPIIFANWNELYIAQWDGLDIVVDNITLAGKAQLKIIINGWYDVNLRHLQSFAAIKDARNV